MEWLGKLYASFLQGDLTERKEKESNNVILFSILYKYEAIIFVLKHNERCIIGFAHIVTMLETFVQIF